MLKMPSDFDTGFIIIQSPFSCLPGLNSMPVELLVVFMGLTVYLLLMSVMLDNNTSREMPKIGVVFKEINTFKNIEVTAFSMVFGVKDENIIYNDGVYNCR